MARKPTAIYARAASLYSLSIRFLNLNLRQGMASSIPVLGAFLSGSDLINAIATVFAEDEAKAPAVQPYKNRMPICSDTELRGLLDDFPRLTDLIDNIPDLGSRDTLYDYIRSKLAWRREIWANMPICAESLEIGMLIHQIASDAATAEALGYHDLPEYLNPYIGFGDRGTRGIAQCA